MNSSLIKQAEKLFGIAERAALVVWILSFLVILFRPQPLGFRRFLLLLGIVATLSTLVYFLATSFLPQVAVQKSLLQRSSSLQVSQLYCAVGVTLYGADVLYPLAVGLLAGGIVMYLRNLIHRF